MTVRKRVPYKKNPTISASEAERRMNAAMAVFITGIEEQNKKPLCKREREELIHFFAPAFLDLLCAGYKIIPDKKQKPK